MFMKANSWLISSLILVLLVCAVQPAAALKVMSRHPYLSVITVDADTGKVLYEDNADAKGYPASVTKLMVLLILLEAIDAHKLTLEEPVTVTAAASKIGGSQVYLAENEVFPVEELLYALVIESANDVAVALAIHYAGSKDAFVELMNARAQEIGMKDTVFHSVHGLPPGRGQLPDVSTARDLVKLSLVLVKKSEVFKYTSLRTRLFRTDADEPFIMTSSNTLLKTMKGCDGLKTGFFFAAGFSIVATAAKADKRAVAVVLGAENQKVRDSKAKKMLTEGLSELMTFMPPRNPPIVPTPALSRDSEQKQKSTIKTVGVGISCVMMIGFVLLTIKGRIRDDHRIG
jgi:D-alanyl-D-alanine carboxypeptidase (penicillin-binding protein 5/6)